MDDLQKEKLSKKAMPAVLLTIFLDVMGLGILMPILPELVDPNSANYIVKSFVTFGWLLGSFAIATFIAAPILGQLSDKFGRKKILAILLVGTAIGYFLFAFGIRQKSILILFISRILDGITGGNLPVAQAVIADVSTEKNRTKNFGLMGMMFGLGFALAPYIGGRLATPNTNFFGLFTTPSWFNLTTPFLLAGTLATLNVILVLTRIPKTREFAHGLKIDFSKSLHDIKKAVTHEQLKKILIPLMIFFGGFGFFQGFFNIYLNNKIGLTKIQLSDFFLFFGFMLAVSQGTLVPLLAKKFNTHNILKGAMLLAPLALYSFMIPKTVHQLYLVPILFCPVIGLVFANSIALMSSTAGADAQGEVLGINASVQNFGSAIPLVLSGYIATKLNVKAPIIVGVIFLAIAGLLFQFWYKHKNIEPVHESK